MTEAIEQTKARTTRRANLNRQNPVAAMPPIPAVAPSHPDAKCIATCRRFLDALGAIEQAEQIRGQSETNLDQIDSEFRHATNAAMDLRPTTPEGRLAHARVAFYALLWKVAPLVDLTWQEQCERQEAIALQALAGAAGIELA